MDPAFLGSNPLAATAEDILYGQLILSAYGQGFGRDPLPIDSDLAALGFNLLDVTFSHDDTEPEVCYGFIAQNLRTGDLHEVWRGTQDQAEWLGNAEFWPRPVAWAGPKAKIEHGFGCVIENARYASGRSQGFYDIVAVEGHSMGAAVAEGRAARLGAQYAGLWACPRLGNQFWDNFLAERVTRVFRPYNLGDKVPDVPFDLPPFFEYAHPPGFQIDSGAAVWPTLGARHQLRTYLHALDPRIPLDPSYAAAG